jgi:wyosine [tRNA(Phe)-imidazoG37] synthetase (radical SAM superfamily)
VVAEVLAYADRVRPRLPVRILTNGSEARRPVVRRALDNLDERIVKLDAARDRVNRPTADATESVAAVSELRDTILHSCFVEGACSNCDPESVSNWMERVGEVQPRAVRIHSIRPEAATLSMWPVSQARLREIERQVQSVWAIDTDVFPWIPRSFPALKYGD